MSYPAVRAGCAVRQEPGPRGTIGLLVKGEGDSVYAVVPSSVVPPGARALAMVDHRTVRLSPGQHRPGDKNQEHPALVTLRVPKGHDVLANVAGVAQAGEPVDLVDVLRQDLLIHHQSGTSRGRVAGFGARYRLSGLEPEIELEGLIELEVSSGAMLRAGDAGALVTTEDANPLGLVVGSTGDGLVVAPLSLFLRSLGLAPLQTHGAMLHNAAAIVSARVISAPLVSSTGRQMTAGVRSDELIRRSKLPDLIAELEAETA